MTRVSERPHPQKTTQKEPVGPTPAPVKDDAAESAVDIEQLSTTKHDSFGSAGPRLARGEFAAPAVRSRDDGVDLLIDDASEPRVSTESNAVAGMMGAVPAPRLPSSTFATVDDAVAALEHDYGVKVDRGGFALEELSRVHESLALVPKRDRAALAGVELVREPDAPPELQAKRKDGGIVAGAFFEGTTLDSEGQRARGPHIAFYDAAFPSTTNPAEDRRLSQSVVLHEGAHAVEGRAAGDVKAAFAVAQAARKAADADADEARAPLERSLAAYRAVDESEPSSRAFSDASEAWIKALNALRVAQTPAALAKAQAALTKATRTRDTALAKLPEGQVKDSAQDLAEKQDAFSAPELRAAASRVDEELALKKLRPLVAEPKSADAQHVIDAPTNTIVSFEKEVTMPVTGYGSDGPDENFAEAYALYRRDPQLLKHDNPPAYLYMKKHFP